MWQKEVCDEDVQKVFKANAFLWAFVVAWLKSDKTGDQVFMEAQLRAMNAFDMKHGMPPHGQAWAHRAVAAMAMAPAPAPALALA